MALLQGDGSALPGLGLEGGVLAEAKLDALAETAEEGSFVCGSPAEARRSSIAVDSGWGLTVGAEDIGVVFGHCFSSPGRGRDLRNGKGKIKRTIIINRPPRDFFETRLRPKRKQKQMLHQDCAVGAVSVSINQLVE
jgi:hypothetical protein